MTRKGDGLLASAMNSAAAELGDDSHRNNLTPEASSNEPTKTALLYLRVSSAA